jgi:hypothetical protein
MWKRFNEPTTEPREVLLKELPKMINQFEKKNKINFYKNKNKRTGEITTRFHIIQHKLLKKCYQNCLLIFFILFREYRLYEL